MEEVQPVAVPIRAQLMPDYYPEFHCITSQCKDSCCCYNWRITLKKNDYMTMRSCCKKGELKERFSQGVRRARRDAVTEEEYASFVMQDGKCPFLSGTGLCILQLECGEESLSHVCRTFPRVVVMTPWGLEESSCSSGCEAVLHLLYARREGLGFLMEDIPTQSQKEFSFLRETPLGAENEAVRELCIDILQSRHLPLSRRMLLLGWVLRDLTEAIPADLGQWIRQKRALIEAEEVHTLLGELKGDKAIFAAHHVCQILEEGDAVADIVAFRTKALTYLQVEAGENGITKINMENYRAAEAAVLNNYGDLDFFFENILVNAFFYKQYPAWGGMKDIWKNYLIFCDFYSKLRFFFVCGCYDCNDLEELFHVLTLASRITLHAPTTKQESFVERLVEAGNATLADMAVLVCG